MWRNAPEVLNYFTQQKSIQSLQHCREGNAGRIFFQKTEWASFWVTRQLMILYRELGAAYPPDDC